MRALGGFRLLSLEGYSVRPAALPADGKSPVGRIFVCERSEEITICWRNFDGFDVGVRGRDEAADG